MDREGRVTVRAVVEPLVIDYVVAALDAGPGVVNLWIRHAGGLTTDQLRAATSKEMSGGAPLELPDVAIRAVDLRRVPLGELVKVAVIELARFSRVEFLADRPRLQSWAAQYRRKRAGALPVDDHFLALLAAEYVDLVELAPNPVAVLADKRFLSYSRTRNLLTEARERGLLSPPPTPRGIAGGQLTPKARKLLKQEEA